MRLALTLLTLSFFAITTFAQNRVYLTGDVGQLFSNFRYLDADGIKDKDYNANISGTYNLGLAKHFEKGLIIKSTLGNRKAGASMVYNETNYAWNLQYLDIKAGAGFSFDKLITSYFAKKWRMQPYVLGSPFFSYLLKANQSLNGVNYDIKKSKVIKTMDFGIVTSGGLNIVLSNDFSVFAEFNYLLGLQNIETKLSNQKLNNRAYSINIGLAANIK